MKLSLAALLLAASLPAAAQVRAPEAARYRALESALTAMNDGPEAGGAVSRAIEENKIAVEFASQAEPAVSAAYGGRLVIRLSDALPAHPRVYAPLIAAQAARRMFADMPASAERSYMRRAIAARVFAELGGDFRALPAVDGDSAPAVKDAVAAWLTDAQTALRDAGRADGVPYLSELQGADEANRRFTAFLLDESDARRAAR